jgi:hypothetical protein
MSFTLQNVGAYTVLYVASAVLGKYRDGHL